MDTEKTNLAKNKVCPYLSGLTNHDESWVTCLGQECVCYELVPNLVYGRFWEGPVGRNWRHVCVKYGVTFGETK